MKIIVLFGGESTEHEVSLISALSVARALVEANFEVILIGISKKGEWFLLPREESERILQEESASLYVPSKSSRVYVLPGGGKKSFFTKQEVIEADAVFPVLHGSYGEDGCVQGLLEMASIAYVGACVLSSALTMDKEKTKILVDAAGIKIVPYKCITRREMMNSSLYDKFFEECLSTLSLPLFVKPANSGSSKGAMKAKTKKEFSYALMMASTFDHKILVEKALDVREIECSVTGNSVTASKEAEDVRSYTPGEVVVKSEFYDYNAKYKDENAATLVIPAEIGEEKLTEVRKTAEKAYKALDLSGLCRMDFFLEKGTNTLYFNEANSMPGFTSISMFPKMCEKSSLDFPSLVTLLVEQALSFHKAKIRLDRGGV